MRHIFCLTFLLSFSLSSILAESFTQKFKDKIKNGIDFSKQKLNDAKNRIIEGTKDIVHDIRELKNDIPVVWNAMKHPHDRVNFIMVALGDSITSGVNATCPGNRCLDLRLVHDKKNLNPVVHKQVSWSTGDDSKSGVESHLQKLIKSRPKEVIVGLNYSVYGTFSSDVTRQADETLKNYAPHYVTILTGANDICVEHSDPKAHVDEYEKAIVDTIEKFKKKRLGVKILLVGIPDLEHLYHMGKDSKATKTLWRIWNFCQPLLGEKATAESQSMVSKRRVWLNKKLIEIASRPEYKNNVKVATKLMDAKFEKKHISVYDGFHPSLEGQAALSDSTWSESWFN